jgi:hypothetical protein
MSEATVNLDNKMQLQRVLIVIAFLGLLFTLSVLIQGDRITLIENGKSDYVIVLSPIASPSEEFAAVDLQDVLEKMSGCKLPIVSPEHSVSGKHIYIGSDLLWEEKVPDVDLAAFGDEEFLIRTAANDLIIAGGPKRGTMYGVFTFMEKYLGCRWYTAQVSKVPVKQTIKIGPINDRQLPAFEYREVLFPEARNRSWALHNRMNGAAADLPEEVGGKIACSDSVLTFDHLHLSEKDLRGHPGYSPDSNSRRMNENMPPFLAKPQVRHRASETIEKWIRENPPADIYPIFANDANRPGDCDSCRKITLREGSQVASTLAFVNAIAGTLAVRHPDKRYAFYADSEPPPEIMNAADNVIIHLRQTNPGCAAHPLTQCAGNAEFVGRIAAWHKKAKHIYVRYPVDNCFHFLLPFPNFNSIRDDLPFLCNSGIAGISCIGSDEPGSEFAELRSYILAKLLWNPHFPIDGVIDDFLKGVYGRAWKPIRRYFDLLHERARIPDLHFNRFSDPDSLWLTAQMLEKADEYFVAAEHQVENEPATLARVKLAHLPVYYARLWFLAQANRIAGGPMELEIISRFKRIAYENDIESVGPGISVSSFLEMINSDSIHFREQDMPEPLN